MKKYIIQNTKTLEFVYNVRATGLSKSWGSDQTKAQPLELDRAERIVRNLNLIVPGRARALEIEVEV